MTSFFCSCSLFIPEKYLKNMPGHTEEQPQKIESTRSYSKKDILGAWVQVGRKEAGKQVFAVTADLMILEFGKNGDMIRTLEQAGTDTMKFKFREPDVLVYVDKNGTEARANLILQDYYLILIHKDSSSDKYKQITTATGNISKQGRLILNEEIIRTSGNCFAGNCVNGYGSYLWPSGDRYDGQWKDSKKNGKGTLTSPAGSGYLKYAGMWKNDDFGGQGTMTYGDGKVFTGSWLKGKKEGNGVLYNPDGSVFKKGRWRNDQFID